jgi:hypothetical protein
VPSLHLTDISVRALKASDKTTYYWDTTTPAFGIRVGKRAKAWTVIRGRNRERVTIGHYPAMKLADARTQAKRLLSAEPEDKGVRITFADARAEFLEDNYRDASPNTKYQVKRSLERHFKALEAQRLSEISDGDIKKTLDRLAKTPSEQLHAYRYVRCLLRWATRSPRRYIRHSPMEGYDPPGTDRKGTRILSDDELRAVWRAAEGYPRCVVRLMVLWGTRRGETAVLERLWAKDGVLTIPGEHTKNGRDHAIPVLPIAQWVLGSAEGTNQHYFRSRWGHRHLSLEGLHKAKQEVMEASGTSGWQLRDLRRTFRSTMARLGVPRDVCEVLINHAPPVLDEIYDRYDRLAEKRDALRRYEHFLIWLLAQGET